VTDSPEWLDARATAHVFDWVPGEIRPVNVKDPETSDLLAAGLLVLVNDDMRAQFPQPPSPALKTKGCDCGN
jgi:hypothetical protein